MLDKSVPLRKVVMKLNASDNTVSDPILPEGYSFSMYSEGDEHHWARIETSVLEFSEEPEALEHFTKDFLPYIDELKKRCVFICNPQKLPVATTTAWFCLSGKETYSQLHWAAVCPDHQKKGLGKAVMQRVLVLFQLLAPGKDVWLGTQTWSHEAIYLYHKLGFRIVREEVFSLSSNREPPTPKPPYDADAALEILKDVYDQDLFREITARMC